MFFKQLELTTALRPALTPDETLLFVQDAVGLYEGKYKLPNHQKGHAYLTTFRVCYVDDENPRQNSLALELRDVDSFEFQAGFLKSSSKITFHPKPVKRPFGQNRLSNPGLGSLSSSPSRDGSPISRTSSPHQSVTTTAPASTATWICPICSFSNPVPSNFDIRSPGPQTPLPPCLACGIKPPLATVLKAAISASSNRGATQLSHHRNVPDADSLSENVRNTSEGLTAVDCPRCTFSNHPSMLACEICGAPLLASEDLRSGIDGGVTRSESPGPQLERLSLNDGDYLEPVKISFRAGGEKIFHERLKGAMVQRKWLLRNAPPVPPPIHQQGPQSDAYSQASGNGQQQQLKSMSAGIAGLEQRGLESRKNAERVIGGAFEDLEALMASAKDIVALAEQFAQDTARTSESSDREAKSVLSESAAALGMVTTKDMLGSGGNSETLYLNELSRNLAEYLADDTRGVLLREGGIMSLVDLWAVFNGSRNGVELISPSDFGKAARLWEKLKLPVRLRQFKSGLLVVQRTDRSDERTIQQIRSWLQSLPTLRGITAQETAQQFGWSVGVATEELEMAEEHGALCREGNVEGLRFWLNLLILDEQDVLKALARMDL